MYTCAEENSYEVVYYATESTTNVFQTWRENSTAFLGREKLLLLINIALLRTSWSKEYRVAEILGRSYIMPDNAAIGYSPFCIQHVVTNIVKFYL